MLCGQSHCWMCFTDIFWLVKLTVFTLNAWNEKQSANKLQRHSVIACSSDMFDIRSNIRRHYDQIFQTYLTISGDDRRRFCSAFTNNIRSHQWPRIATVIPIGERERHIQSPLRRNALLRHALKWCRVDLQWHGGLTESDGRENDGPICRTWKCRTWTWRTKNDGRAWNRGRKSTVFTSVIFTSSISAPPTWSILDVCSVHATWSCHFFLAIQLIWVTLWLIRCNTN